MSTRKPRTLILCGDGLSGEQEAAHAFRLVGFDADIRHLNDLISERLRLDELSSRYSVFSIPGGFSFGDDLTPGKVLALKIRHKLGWNLGTFAERGGLVLGICNGFQALIRMEVFGRDLSITRNAQGKFIDAWVKVTPAGTRCVWLKGVGTMDLPIRHGEGRIVIAPTRKTEILGKMERQGMACLQYDGDPDGSEERLAGLCDATGRIFGLMPHPEAFVRWTEHPEWTSQPGRASAPGQGLALFENAFKEASSALG
ncbi:MAG: phosphoribosylformylglycinamidine synthase subunit PurQ [Oligoflexia bacterium]|nr:phosphoribosylformylglycinamidine synthase subunit PurQ [Oligoflexia bacterium]